MCRSRLRDCAAELRVLLLEEKLAGASLLVLANKQDLPGALPLDHIERVRLQCSCMHTSVTFCDPHPAVISTASVLNGSASDYDCAALRC